MHYMSCITLSILWISHNIRDQIEFFYLPFKLLRDESFQ